MSIVAWDGKTLAADCMMVNSGLKARTKKIWEFEHSLLAITGDVDTGLAMVDWYMQGTDRKEFPATQSTDNWARLIVVRKSDKLIFAYEKTIYPIVYTEPFLAFGSGRDYAYGAMAMGATAERACEIACEFDNHCGFGVDSYHV